MSAERDLSCDILQPIPLEEWPLLRDLLRDKWPSYAYYYYWIENSIKWKTQQPDLPLHIYCPDGKYNDCTFVGLSTFTIYNTIVFTRDPTGERLRRAILETDRIDWNQEVIFCAVHEHMQPTLFSTLAELKAKLRIEIHDSIPGSYYFKPADECTNVEVVVPDECYLGTLNESHVLTIHNIWPHRNKQQPEKTIRFLTYLITINGGVGLFLKEDDTLVSWILQTDFHGLGMVQTIEAHKRKGYAKVVINVIAKKLAEEGISPTLFIVKGNDASTRVFESLKWKRTHEIIWVWTKKNIK